MHGVGAATLTKDKKELLGADDNSNAPHTRKMFQPPGDHCAYVEG